MNLSHSKRDFWWFHSAALRAGLSHNHYQKIEIDRGGCVIINLASPMFTAMYLRQRFGKPVGRIVGRKTLPPAGRCTCSTSPEGACRVPGPLVRTAERVYGNRRSQA